MTIDLNIGQEDNWDYAHRTGLFSATGNYTSSLSLTLLDNFTLYDADYDAFHEVLLSYGRVFDTVFLLEKRLDKQQVLGMRKSPTNYSLFFDSHAPILVML